MPPLDPHPPDKRNPTSGISGSVIYPAVFQHVNNRTQRLQEGLEFNAIFADAIERDLRVRCMRKYLGEETKY